MSNNIFSWNRFVLLFKQHFIHNAQFIMLATVAYIGVIFIVLSVAQIANDLLPHSLESFQPFLAAFVTVFGVLYVGYSFPAFRSKESTIHYLMIPASTLEKFTFEFVIRIVLILVALPLLFWITFNMQGYFFAIFSPEEFRFVGIQHLVTLEIPAEHRVIIYSMIIGGVLFALTLAFTGAAMFSKQPLVKTLFAVAVVVMFFVGYSFIVITQFELDGYHPPDRMILVPLEEETALPLVSLALFVGTAVMLFVAFQKLKEREV